MKGHPKEVSAGQDWKQSGVPGLTVVDTEQQRKKTVLDVGGKRESLIPREQRRDSINCALGRLIWQDDMYKGLF